ncbi:hypothetical protein [Marinobacter zhejiangensis]|nr:hypothetical protein [Marinobacter zhejiangensis]
MYKEEDIKVLKGKDVIKKRPEMYFGSRGINPDTICSAIIETALIFGAKKTQVNVINGWQFICSDLDWMVAKNVVAEVNEDSLFENIFGFPEMGVNCLRWEAFTTYFSDATLTTNQFGTKVISGSNTDKNEYESLVKDFIQWGRIIGFKFNAEA